MLTTDRAITHGITISVEIGS